MSIGSANSLMWAFMRAWKARLPLDWEDRGFAFKVSLGLQTSEVFETSEVLFDHFLNVRLFDSSTFRPYDRNKKGVSQS